VVTQEALEPDIDAGTLLDGCDLAPILSLTGMVAAKVGPVAVVPAGLELEVPRDDAGCAAIVDVNGAAYAMDMSAAKGVLGRAAFWGDQFPVVGRVGGRAVCCAATLRVDGHRYVAWVATLPGEQRKGYADAAMRRCLELSARAHGEVPTVLHATDAGRPIYERMGYRAIATHTVFMEKRFL
jgi:GNAT superfamily N-acetyltransferase